MSSGSYPYFVWWKAKMLLLSNSQMSDAGLLDHILKQPRRYGGISGQLRLFI